VIQGTLSGVEIFNDLGGDVQQIKQRVEALYVNIFLKVQVCAVLLILEVLRSI
jgi:hypothetical protein